MRSKASQPLYTTFRLLRKAYACPSRYKHLAKALGGIQHYGQDKPIPLAKIIETNGLDDALFALQCVPDEQIERGEKVGRALLRLGKRAGEYRRDKGRDLLRAAWYEAWRILKDYGTKAAMGRRQKKVHETLLERS